MKDKIKIGLVLTSAPGYSETFLTSKINGLIDHGYEVSLFVSNNLRKVPAHWKVYTQPAVRGSYGQIIGTSVKNIIILLFRHPIRIIKYLSLEFKDGSPFLKASKSLISNSHILSHQLDWLHFGFATNTLGRENVAAAIGAKMSVSLRGFDICIYPLKNPGCYDKLWRRVDKVHVISDDLSEEAERTGLGKQVPVVKITPAIDVDKFSFRQGFAVQSELKIITTGRLIWKKGYEYAFLAMKILKSRGIKFHYTIIGEGEGYERLVFARYQLGLDDQVTFKGRIPHDQVLKEIKQNDFYLQPSVQEGFCNAVLEAQAIGMLCIVTNAEGLSENVLNNHTGWVVPTRNPKAIADKIEEVLKLSPEALEQIRVTASERVKREFNIRKQQSEFVDFFSAPPLQKILKVSL